MLTSNRLIVMMTMTMKMSTLVLRILFHHNHVRDGSPRDLDPVSFGTDATTPSVTVAVADCPIFSFQKRYSNCSIDVQ